MMNLQVFEMCFQVPMWKFLVSHESWNYQLNIDRWVNRKSNDLSQFWKIYQCSVNHKNIQWLDDFLVIVFQLNLKIHKLRN